MLTSQVTSPPAAPAAEVGGRRGARFAGATAVLAGLTLVLLLAAGWHITQGTSGVGLADLLRLLLGLDPDGTGADGTGTGGTGAGHQLTRDVLIGSRIPRLAAGIAVGFALGVAGALLQSLARNPLASPDTLAVTAGAYFAVTAVAVFGLAVPIWASGTVAFAGGLAAGGVVLLLAGGAGTSTTRLVLAGSAVMLAVQAGTATLLILFPEQTTGLFAWGSGSLSQLGLTAFAWAAPVVVAAVAWAVLMGRRLDLLAIGDDTARVLGVPFRSTRIAGVVLAVLLTAAAVTLAGPIGFVGLCAPVLVRLAGRATPGVQRHAVLIPASGLAGALIVVLADAIIRALVGPEAAHAIPTGVTTSLAGAFVLVALARRMRDSGPTREPAAAHVGTHGVRRFWVVLTCGVTLAAGALLLGLLSGSTWLRTGDILLWLNGEGAPVIRFALDERAPRVVAALVAGGALALSGALVQATARNPLAEPGILGITGGAGLGAVIALSAGLESRNVMLTAAVLGGMLAFALVYGLSARRGLHADRLVLVGIGVWYGTTALTTYLLLRANPWDTPRIYTWLSGTTYGRSWSQVVPVIVALAIALPVAFVVRRELDLLALDDDTPRLVGIGVERVRLLVLAVAAGLAAISVIAVGVVGFVGLVAPHAARALVGGRHARSVPVAVLLGMTLLVVADTVGRVAIAPAQIPAGLVVALIGAPYFVYLLARSRV